jgi:hypothetical protein
VSVISTEVAGRGWGGVGGESHAGQRRKIEEKSSVPPLSKAKR